MNGFARWVRSERMGESREEFLKEFFSRGPFLGRKGVIMTFWFHAWQGGALHTDVIQERFVFDVFSQFGSGAQDPNQKALLNEGDPLSRLEVALRVVGHVMSFSSRDRTYVGPVIAIFILLGEPSFVDKLLGGMTFSP